MRTVGLIVALTLGMLSGSLAAGAQPAAKVARIGFLSTVNPRTVPQFVAFFLRLHELGYVEGQNLTVEFRNAEGQVDRLPELAAELVRLKVDLIVAPGAEIVLRAAQQATTTIPVVMVAVDYDPIALGYVAGLARPGGSITGVVLNQLELAAKRLELLKQALPKVTRVAVLWDAISADQLKAAQAAAPSLGVRLQPLELRNPPYEFDSAFRAAAGERAGALLILASANLFRGSGRIAELATQRRLPSIAGNPIYAEAGVLMSYGASLPGMFRRAAEYVDKILKGAKPADLPVEQPTRFEMVLNLKTAKALGLTLPQSILLRVDKVIQ